MPVGEVYLSDNSGNRVPPTPQLADPVAGSGISKTLATSGNDYEQTLVAGEMYIITFVATAGLRMLASTTGVTSTAANIEWVFMANTEYIFHMPFGKTTLYCESNATNGYVFLRKLAK